MNSQKHQFMPDPTQQYKIVSADNSDICLTMSKSIIKYGKLVTDIYNDSINQKFVLKYTPMFKSIKIYNQIRNQLVGLKVNQFSNGQFLKFTPIQMIETQQWYFEPIKQHFSPFNSKESILYRIKAKSGHYIDLQNERLDKGNEAVIWTRTSSMTQKWRIVEV